MANTRPFFSYARARENVRIAKEAGEPFPWTADPILSKHRFCNVFREDDKVTRWFKENLRDPLDGSGKVLLATVAFRWFNRIPTGEVLKDSAIGLWDGKWNTEEAIRRIRHALPEGPWVTAAYMVKTEAKTPKVEAICNYIGNVQDSLWELAKYVDPQETPQQMLWERLCELPYIGPFTAYEIVTDLNNTRWFGPAPDTMTWANPGPGAARGLSRIYGLPLDHFDRFNAQHCEVMNELMQDLLARSRSNAHWPERWRPWTMREVEHTLCEFDKYERARLGQGRPKQLYREGQDYT